MNETEKPSGIRRIKLAWLIRLSKRTALVVLGALLALLGFRSYKAVTGDPLEPWHKYGPAELAQRDLAKADWQAYIDREDKLMEEVRQKVSLQMPREGGDLSNRYHPDSTLNPDRFERNWNRSYVMLPDGEPLGSVVLLHGLTDSPYSMRHVAAHYRDCGFAAVCIRLPGHGTVPAGLVRMDWKTWDQATKLAVREATRLAGEQKPLHLVGFSNGGALAMKYALDAVGDDSLARPSQIVLFSPMIGVTEMARFAGIAGWPSVFPAFARTAWLSILPEFNPFKYNSFPVNGARQSSLLTRSLQPRLASYARNGRAVEMPPVLTFQSMVDFTTSTRAVIDSLYSNLPPNGSELILFDINRRINYGPLMGARADIVLNRFLPPPPRDYTVSVITNSSPKTSEVLEARVPSGTTEENRRELGLAFPQGVFSLSHVAVPFPLDDSLYGIEPRGEPEFGAHLGAVSLRGERGTLIVPLDSLVRMSCNPFHPYVIEKIDEVLRRDLAQD